MTSLTFAALLRQRREIAGQTLRDLERASGITSSTLSRWELAQTTPRRDDVVRVDQALGADGALVKAWTTQTTGSTLPPWMRDVASVMDEAVSIECLSPSLVPGLLQCPEYAEAVLCAGQPLLPRDEVRTLADTRGRRYEELRTGNDPAVTAVMPERALALVPEPIRRAQAAFLCGVIDSGRVSVSLIPDDVLVLGLISPLVLMRLPDGGRVGFSDHLVGNEILDDTMDWPRVDETVRRVYTLANPAHHSRTTIGGYR